MNTKENTYEEKLIRDGYKLVVKVAENLLLRPNDTRTLLGDERFEQMKRAEEKILEMKYKDDEIYKYYYELNNYNHGFCTFERWKLGLLL